jgi:spore coat protein U-like protein
MMRDPSQRAAPVGATTGGVRPAFLRKAGRSPRSAVAFAAVLLASLVLSPKLTDVRPAEAGQKSATFKVSTTLIVGCTFTVADMTFPNYTSGQNGIDPGASNFQIFCSSATVGNPVPVTYTVNAPGGFKMSHGASLLNYELCFDAACTVVIPNGSASALLVDRALYSQPYYGEVFAHQVGPTGAYSQVVSVTITF